MTWNLYSCRAVPSFIIAFIRTWLCRHLLHNQVALISTGHGLVRIGPRDNVILRSVLTDIIYKWNIRNLQVILHFSCPYFYIFSHTDIDTNIKQTQRKCNCEQRINRNKSLLIIESLQQTMHVKHIKYNYSFQPFFLQHCYASLYILFWLFWALHWKKTALVHRLH